MWTSRTAFVFRGYQIKASWADQVNDWPILNKTSDFYFCLSVTDGKTTSHLGSYDTTDNPMKYITQVLLPNLLKDHEEFYSKVEERPAEEEPKEERRGLYLL